MAETVRALVDRGIPVIGHLGLTPAVGARARRVPGAGAGRPAAADRLLADARALEEAGACAIVLELLPTDAGPAGHGRAHASPPSASAPASAATARCWCCTTCSASTRGSSPSSSSATPSWARRSARRCATYAAEVRDGRYPGPEHSFE